jgi:hemoglobin-like flavoprotein
MPVPIVTGTGEARPGPGKATLTTLDPHTIALVQNSWAQVMPIADAAATLFYDRLFALDPPVRALFKSDMREQKKKLMQTIGVAVDGLNNPARLVPALRTLGLRHAGYMVEAHHYDLVGDALVWTLREGLGDGFTAALEAAWKDVYGAIAGIMLQAAAEEASTGVDAAEERAETTRDGDGLAADEPATLHYTRVSGGQVGAPAAGAAPGGLIIPLSGQEAALRVHLTLEQAPGQAADGAGVAVALAAICGAAVVAASSVLVFGLGSPGEGGSLAVLLGLPLAAMVIASVAFLLGYLWGQRSGRPSAPAAGSDRRR